MEKPIEYYEVALEYAKANGVAISDEEVAALIAMVKARDSDVLARQNVILQGLLGQQLCVTRTLEKEIAELKQAVSPASCTLDDSIKVGFAIIGLDGGNNKFLYQHQVYGSKFSATGNFDLYALASQQGGEVK